MTKDTAASTARLIQVGLAVQDGYHNGGSARHSPMVFSWITGSNLLVFEQQAGPSLRVTIRARVKQGNQ